MTESQSDIQLTNYFSGGDRKREELLAEPAQNCTPCKGCSPTKCLTCANCKCSCMACPCFGEPHLMIVPYLLVMHLYYDNSDDTSYLKFKANFGDHDNQNNGSNMQSDTAQGILQQAPGG